MDTECPVDGAGPAASTRFPQLDVNMTSGAPVVVDGLLAERLTADIRTEVGGGATKVLAMAARERSRLAVRILREILAVMSEED